MAATVPGIWIMSTSFQEENTVLKLHLPTNTLTHKNLKENAGVQSQEKLGRPSSSSPSSSGRTARMEKLWQEFFSDPTQWHDYRITKKNPNHPDFKKRSTLQSLWLDCQFNPPWVNSKIATMDLDHGQSSKDLISRAPSSSGDGEKVKELCEEGHLREALYMVKLMIQQTTEVPFGTYVCLLKECAKRKALAEGKQVHALIIRRKCDTNLFLANNLIDMYSNCGSVLDARKVFARMPRRNIFSWTAIISAYAYNGQYEEAINLFQQMLKRGITPDKVVIIVVLRACANALALEQGKQLHSLILQKGLQCDLIVQSALVDMYAKCGCLEDARDLFDNMKERDVISWTGMISGYVENGLGKEALTLYEQMKQEGVHPNKVTVVVALKACANVAGFEQGQQLHSLVLKRGWQYDIIVQSALVDMYTKCGCLEDAREVFNSMSQRDTVSWNTMIGAYAWNGLGKEALSLYEQMKQEGVKPNDVTFLSVLSACSHSGLFHEGRHVFESMLKDHSITPTLKHYACMVDLLGRAGCLADAEDFIKHMPIQPGVEIWTSLLGAARIHCDVEVGKRAFESILKLEPEKASPYLMLMEIYAAAGRMNDLSQIKKEMEDKSLQ